MNDGKHVDGQIDNWFDYLARGICAIKVSDYCTAARGALLLGKDPRRLGILATDRQSRLQEPEIGLCVEVIILSLSQRLTAQHLLAKRRLGDQNSSLVEDWHGHLGPEELVAVIEYYKLECSEISYNKTIWVVSVVNTAVQATRAPIICHEKQLIVLTAPHADRPTCYMKCTPGSEA